jgi:hypothetical protein
LKQRVTGASRPRTDDVFRQDAPHAVASVAAFAHRMHDRVEKAVLDEKVGYRVRGDSQAPGGPHRELRHQLVGFAISPTTRKSLSVRIRTTEAFKYEDTFGGYTAPGAAS